jgi:hypothetical protein
MNDLLSVSRLTRLLQFAALCHLGLVWAGASMPRAVDLQNHLANLPAFIRRLFFVYFAFIGLVLVGFGCLTFVYAPAMARGVPVARGLCLLMAAFWLARLVVAAFVFDVRPYLTTRLYRLGYQATNLVFVYLVFVYALAAWKRGNL